MASSGFFLSFEGVDGCGKSTQIERLAQRLRGSGRRPVIAQEPGGTRIGREIRALLLDRANSDLRPIPELLLYFASRAQNIAEVILPALGEGCLVITDRFTDATVAYQGYGRELGVERVRAIEAATCGGLTPDLTIWLDLDPSLGVARALARRSGGPVDETRMERQTAEFYERVRRGYAELHSAEPGRIRRIDASGGIEEVERRIWEAVEPALAALPAV